MVVRSGKWGWLPWLWLSVGHVFPGDPERVTHLPGLSLLPNGGARSIPCKVQEEQRAKRGHVWAQGPFSGAMAAGVSMEIGPGQATPDHHGAHSPQFGSLKGPHETSG